MRFIGRWLGRITEKRGTEQSAEQLIERLRTSGERVGERMAQAADTPRNREVAAHIIGIERWSARRLRTALGDTVARDEYDGYRPATDLTMPELTHVFAETREQTLALAQRVAGLPDSVRVVHNQLGELSVSGWLYYIENHAVRESRRMRGTRANYEFDGEA